MENALSRHREVALEGIEEIVRSAAPSYAMEVADAIDARLEARGSTVDASYLVEIGVARLDLSEADSALRRGEDVDTRRLVGRIDDLLRRLEGAIVRGAQTHDACRI
jgi:hypothetical protein